MTLCLLIMWVKIQKGSPRSTRFDIWLPPVFYPCKISNKKVFPNLFKCITHKEYFQKTCSSDLVSLSTFKTVNYGSLSMPLYLTSVLS